MSKKIYSSADCTDNCLVYHNSKVPHNYFDLSKFINTFNEFTHLDDEHWIEITIIQDKFEELMRNIVKIKSATMEKIRQRRLMHALNIDQRNRQESLINIFKTADDGNYQKLTCKEVAKIYEKISKDRKVNPREIKIITEKIQEQAENEILAIVQKLIPSKTQTVTPSHQDDRKNYVDNRDNRENRENRENRYNRENRDNKNNRDNRPMRRPQHPSARPSRKASQQMQDTKQKKIQLKMRENEYPTLKVEEIQETNTHFNIILKVVDVRKVFQMQGKKRIQFVAGDETGTATVVTTAFTFIRPGTVVSISNAKIYLFHGTIKQIQMSDHGSFVSQENVEIEVNQKYCLSKQENRPYRNNNTGRDKDERPTRKRNVYHKENKQSTEEKHDYRNEHRKRQNQKEQESCTHGSLRKQDKQMVPNISRISNRYEEQYKRQNKRKEEVQKRKEKTVQNMNISDSDQQKQQDIPKPEISRTVIKQPSNDCSYTKIGDISPGDEGLNIIAEIFQVYAQDDQTQKDKIFCRIGDLTAVVDAQLPKLPYVKENVVVQLISVDATVVKHKIRIRLTKDSIVDRTNIHFPKINIQKDMSKQQWQSQNEDEEQNQQQDSGLSATLNTNQIEDF